MIQSPAQPAAPTPPLIPPRPALGGERPDPPLLRPAPAQPQFRPDPPPAYRPIDPAGGYSAQRNRPFNLETGAAPYGNRIARPAGRQIHPDRRGSDGAGFEPSLHPDEARDPRVRPLGSGTLQALA